MRIMLPPKKAFPDTIIYREVIDRGTRGAPIYGDSLEICNVRFDSTVIFDPSSLNSDEQTPNALISLLKKYTGPLPNFVTGSEVFFNGETFTIAKVDPLRFFTSEPFGYEIEVV